MVVLYLIVLYWFNHLFLLLLFLFILFFQYPTNGQLSYVFKLCCKKHYLWFLIAVIVINTLPHSSSFLEHILLYVVSQIFLYHDVYFWRLFFLTCMHLFVCFPPMNFKFYWLLFSLSSIHAMVACFCLKNKLVDSV